MKKVNLTQFLHEITEQELPPAQIDLWPAIHNELTGSAGKGAPGEPLMTPVKTPHRRLRLAVFAALALIVAAGLLIATPQGRALGGRLFQFFNTTEQTSYDIPSDQVAPAPATPTPPEERAVALVEVTEVVSPRPTPAAAPAIALAEVTEAAPPATAAGSLSCDSAAAQSSYFCQIQAVEAQAGFDLKEFPADPKGTVFAQASFNPDTQEARIELQADGGGSTLTLRQGVQKVEDLGGGEVPSTAVQQVSVNGLYAELVSGGFMVYPNATKAVWEPGGMMTLAWQDGARWFVLEKLGDVYPIEWITPEELVRLAEGLVDARSPEAAAQLDPENLPSVAAAEQLAGFDIPTPRLLPAGYVFKRAVWMNGALHLFYGLANADGRALSISLGPIAANQVGPCLDCPPGTTQEVTVNGHPGWFWRGIFHTDAPVAGQPTPAPAWQAEANFWVLSWNTDTLWISMAFSPGEYSGEVMDRETMVRIGESLAIFDF